MKKIILIFIGLAFALFAVNSCKKGDINGDAKKLGTGSYIKLDSVITENLDFSNNAATVGITVSQVGDPIASINVYLATGNVVDPTNWVLIKNVPYSDGVLLTVSTAEVAAALGSTVAAGSSYVFQNEVVTKDGRKYSAVNTPANFLSLAGYHMALTWHATAVCPFVQADAVGNYAVVTDDWADFAVGDIVTVSAGATANELSLIAYPNPAVGGLNRQPILIEVDPVSDVATVVKQGYGTYAGSPYPLYFAETVGSANFVFSCTGSIQLVFQHSVNAGTFSGTFQLTLQKQ